MGNTKKYRIVGSNRQSKKDKAITFGYNLFETNSKKKFIKYINTHAIVCTTLRGGHRAKKNIKEILPVMRLDIDKKGESKIVEKALNDKKIEYIKKPSTSNNGKKNKYKWHYLVMLDEVPQDYNSYKKAYEFFVNDYLGITLKDMTQKAPVTNMNFNTAGMKRVTYKPGNRINLSHIKFTKNSKVSRKKVGDHSKSRIKSLLKNINIKKYKTRDEWMRVIAAIYHAGGESARKLAKNWSKGDKKRYDKDSFDQIWDQLRVGDYGGDISSGTLFMLAGKMIGDPTDDFPNDGELKVVKPKKKKKKYKKIPGLTNLPEKFDLDLERKKEPSRALNSMVRENKLIVLVGSAGSGKTTMMGWMGSEILKKYEEKVLHYWAFDPDDSHKMGMQQYFRNEGIEDRAIITSASVEDMFEYYDTFFTKSKQSERLLKDAIIVIDTYKKIAVNVNDKTLNAKTMDWGKKLTRYGATVIFLAHTNKDGEQHSGTAEIEQDGDAIFRIKREVNNGVATHTIEPGGRVRYKFDTVSYSATLSGDGDQFHTNTMSTMRQVDVDPYTSVFVNVDGDNTYKEAEKKRVREDIAALTKYKKDLYLIYDSIIELSNNKHINVNQDTIARVVGEQSPSSSSTIKRLIKRYATTGMPGITSLWKIEKKKIKGKKQNVISIIKKKKIDKHIRSIIFEKGGMKDG